MSFGANGKKSGGGPSIIIGRGYNRGRCSTPHLPIGRGFVMTRPGNYRTMIVYGTPGGEMAKIKRRPADVARKCNHCVWSHRRQNLNCYANTKVPISVSLPFGTLIDALTGDVVSGRWKLVGTRCIPL